MAKTGKVKRQQNLVILLIILIVVFAAYIGIRSYNNYLEEQEAEAEAEETVSILSYDSAEIKKVYYDNGTDQLTFVYDDSTEEWYYEDDQTLAITQSNINNIVNVASCLTSSKVIEASDDLSEYGLDTPAEEVILYDADGNVLSTIYIGDQNGVSANYYCMVSDDDNVYMISETLPSNISYALDALIETADEETTEETTTETSATE